VQRAYFRAEQIAPLGHWNLWNASGIRFEFHNQTGTRRWNLTAIADRHDNRVEYGWAFTSDAPCGPSPVSCFGARQVERIRYFSNPTQGVAAATELVFAWADRERSGHLVPFSSARQGELVYTSRRLAAIQVWTRPTPEATERTHVYDIVFTYTEHDDDPTAVLLGSIDVRTPSGDVVRVIRRFGYASSLVSISTPTELSSANPIPVQADSLVGDYGVRATDINGDGFADLFSNLDHVDFGDPHNLGHFVRPASDGYNSFLASLGWVAPEHRCIVTGSNPLQRGPCGWMLVDVNGDTRPDLLHLGQPNPPLASPMDNQLFLNTGTTWEPAPGWVINNLRATHMARSRVGTGSSTWSDQELLLRNAVSVYDEVPPLDPDEYPGALEIRDAGLRLGDVNGDGLLDLVRSYHNFEQAEIDPETHVAGRRREVVAVWLQRRNTNGAIEGWDQAYDPMRTAALEALAADADPVFFAYNDKRTGYDLVDVNGDGLADLVRLLHDHKRVLLNTGLGWRDAPGYTQSAIDGGIYRVGRSTSAGPPAPNWVAHRHDHHLDEGLVPIDYNNDGLLDFIQSMWVVDASGEPMMQDRVGAWINTGDGWAPDSRMVGVLTAPATRIALARSEGFGSGSSGMALGWLVADFDGDLRTDFLQLRTPITQQRLQTTLGQMPRLLAREVNELGGTQLLEFTTPAREIDAGWTLMDGDVFNVPSVTVVAEQTRLECAPAPGGDPQCAGATTFLETTFFSYHHAQMGPHGFEQFGEVHEAHNPTTTGPERVTHVRTFEEQGEACRGEFRTLRQRRHDDSLAQEDTQFLETVSLGDGRTRCALNRARRIVYDPAAAPLESNLHFVSDVYGNVTHITDEGFHHVGTDGLVRTTTWTTSADGHVVNLRVRDEDRAHFTNVLLAATRFRYDHLTEGTAGAGVLTQQERLIAEGQWATTAVDVDALGRVTQRTDADGVADQLAYAADLAWASGRTHGVGTSLAETEAMSPNRLHGRPDAFTDRNGRTTTFTRDLVGLLGRITQPGDVASSVGSLDFVLHQRGDPTAQYLETRRPLDGRVLVTREYLDGFGRVKRVEDLGAAPEADRRVVDYEYDLRGNLHRASVQHHLAATPQWVVLDYDALGRLWQVTRPGGFVQSRTFAGAARTVTDPNGHAHTETIDWRGKKVGSSEVVSGVTRATVWEYDPLGRLVRLVDGGGAVSTFGYDMRGVSTSHTDVSTGTTTYDNTLAGRRRFTHRSDGTYVETVYDALGRREKVRTSDGAQTTVLWGADAASNTIGRVASVQTATARTDFAYDDEGRETLRRLTIDGHRYPVTFAYARNGERTSATMPGGRVLTWQLDDFGRPREVLDGTRQLASAVLYNAEDRTTSMKYGNNLLGQFGYDPVTSRPASTKLGGGTLMDATFEFDPNGNVLFTDDPVRPTTPRQDFQYDEANELIAETVGPNTDAYAYDGHGNLLRMADRGFDMDPLHPHRVACVRAYGTTSACGSDSSSHAVNYDARGNVSSRGIMAFTHDLSNRVTQIHKNGNLIQQTEYDGLGGVAAEERAGARSVHVGGWFEQHATWHVIHVPLGNERLASIRVDGFVGEPVMAGTTGLRDWDHGRAAAAARTRGLFWSLLAACVVAAGFVLRSRRAIGARIEALGRAATLRTQWWSARPWKAVALAALALLAFARQDVLVSIAHADPLPTTTTYYHTDLVRSATLLTDDAGDVARRTDYRPYGEERATTGPGSVGFVRTGFQSAAATEAASVSHMGARHYDAELGRFLEADGDQPDVDNPHQLNRYAFAGGNPVSITDPTGHGWIDQLLIAFVVFVAVLTAILTMGAGMAPWIAALVVLGAAVVASVVFWSVNRLVAWAAGSNLYVSFTKALVVGFTVGLLMWLGIMMSSWLALTPQMISTLGWKVVTGWSISHGAEITADLLKGNALDADDWCTHLKWAGTFALFTAASAFGGAVLKSATAWYEKGLIYFWYYGLSVLAKWGPKTLAIGEKLLGMLFHRRVTSVRCGGSSGSIPGCP
jgi:RHS repeat-associated protein